MTAHELFAAFVDAHAAGERPDVRDYLGRAGDERERLGELLDRFLSVAPVEPASEEDVVALHARIEHVAPLTAARTRLPLRVDEVVERLREALGLPESLRARLRDAYQELEAEQLDPRGVDGRVWEALHAILGIDARRLVRPAGPSAAAAVYLRSVGPGVPASTTPARHRESLAHDDVDVLFRARA